MLVRWLLKLFFGGRCGHQTVPAVEVQEKSFFDEYLKCSPGSVGRQIRDHDGRRPVPIESSRGLCLCLEQGYNKVTCGSAGSHHNHPEKSVHSSSPLSILSPLFQFEPTSYDLRTFYGYKK